MEKFIHSVTLDKDLCKGCINCIKRCPTEAIRVRDGKAHILAERCVDCGECIRICPHHAKKPLYDPAHPGEYALDGDAAPMHAVRADFIWAVVLTAAGAALLALYVI